LAIPIETDRLLLRDFVEEDWRAVHEYGSDPEVVRYLPWGPNTEEDSRDFIGRAIAIQNEDPRRRFEIGIVLKEEGRLIGGCGIRENNATLREGNIGYVLNRIYWGRGIATEAARAIVRFGFETLNLHRIFATCFPENKASERVLQKCGMSLEGRLRENLMMRGEWRDSLLYAIIDHEWTGQSSKAD
jgi:RimJ/RimL family protein N-acetyltransferase